LTTPKTSNSTPYKKTFILLPTKPKIFNSTDMKNMTKTLFITLIFFAFYKLSAQTELTFSDKPLICKGHRTTVNEAIFSHDGKELITCGGNNQIIIFNSSNGEVLRSTETEGQGSPVNYVSLNFDGTLLVSAGFSGTNIKIRNFSSLTLKTSISDFGSIDDLCFSPTENILAIVGGVKGSEKQVIALYNAETGVRLKDLYVQGRDEALPTTLAFSNDGRFLASGLSNANMGIMIWNLETGEKTTHITHKYDVSTICFSPDGQFIAGGGTDNNITIWNASTGEKINTLSGLNNYVSTIDYSPDGKYIAGAGMDHTCTFKMWNTTTGQMIQSVGNKGPDIMSLHFAPDGQSLAVSLRTYGDAFDVTTACIYKTASSIMSDTWYTMSSSKAGFRLEFPVAAEEKTSKDQYYEYYDYVLTHSYAVYQVRATRYLYSIDDNKRKETVSKKIENYKADKTDVIQSSFTINGNTGTDLIGYKGDIRYHYRIIFVDDVFYYILFSARNTASCPEEIRFLESLQIL
jgi:WD40 repeat protein